MLGDRIFNDTRFIHSTQHHSLNTWHKLSTLLVLRIKCWAEKTGLCSRAFYYQGGWEFEGCCLDIKETVIPESWVEDTRLTLVIEWLIVQQMCVDCLPHVLAFRSSVFLAPSFISPSLFQGLFRHNKFTKYWCPCDISKIIFLIGMLHLEIAP